MGKCYKLKIVQIFALLATACVLLCISVNAAPQVKVGFKFSKTEVDYLRKSNNQPARQTAVVVPNVPELDCYTVTYSRTHRGDGTALKTPEGATAAPNQSGIYKAIIAFNDDCEHFCDNGKKTREYPSAFTIRQIHQDTPELKSRSADLVSDEDGKSGSIAVGGKGIISTFWTSGVKPQYSWSAGSNVFVQIEDGKPARFTAIASGEATLSVMLPGDNNYFPSEIASYKVKVVGESEAAGGYGINGAQTNSSGWYTGDVEIYSLNGFDGIEITGTNPVTEDGVTLVSVSHKAQNGALSAPQSITIKKDTAPPLISVTVNDSPYTDAPLGESAWAADTNYVVRAEITDETSGLGRVEYKVNGAEYVTDQNSVFNAEGVKSFPYSHTFAAGGTNTLYLKVTDFAGNIVEKSIVLGEDKASASSISQAEVKLNEEYKVPDEPTQAMLDVQSRLSYLLRCNIDALVAGDVRANADYIEETYNMFVQMTPGERKGLGDEKLATLKKYFTALFMQKGKNADDMDSYFDFTIPAISQSTPAFSQPQSVSKTAPTSEEKAKEEKIPQASSASPTKNDEKQSSIPVLYLVPIAVFLAAFVGYFIWKKHMNFNQKSSNDFSDTPMEGSEHLQEFEQMKNEDDDDSY